MKYFGFKDLCYIGLFTIVIGIVNMVISNNTIKHNIKHNEQNDKVYEQITNMKLRMNRNALAIQGVKRIIDNTLDIDNEMSFNYAEEIVKTANRYKNITISLLTSVLFNESRFKTFAVSKAGAMGMGQLMPETVYMVCEKWNKTCTDSTAFEYEFNIRATAWYLDWLYTIPKNSKGDIERTVAYYNGGGRQAYRWGMYRKFLNGVTLDSLETYYMNILHEETKGYVHNVINRDSLFRKSIDSELPMSG